MLKSSLRLLEQKWSLESEREGTNEPRLSYLSPPSHSHESLNIITATRATDRFGVHIVVTASR